MNKMQTRKVINIVMLVVLTALLFTALMMFLPTRTTAMADALPTKIDIEFNPTEIMPGKTILLVVKISSTRSSEKYSASSIKLMPMTETSGTENSQIVLDTKIGNYLSYDRSGNPIRFGGEDAATLADMYDLSINDSQIADATGPNISIGFSGKSTDLDKLYSASKEMIIEIPLKVSEALADDTTLSSATIGIRPNNASKIVYGVGTSKINDYATNAIELGRATASIKIPSTDATLSELKMGIGDDLTAVDLTQSTLSYTVTGKDLANFTILPTANDGATIKVGLTVPATTEAASGEKTKLALSKTTTAVYIDTLAEDGVTTKRYTVGIKIAYVALSSLTVTGSPSPAGVTKNGLEKPLEDGTLEYVVNVPESATTAKLSATIDPDFLIEGTGGNKSIEMKGTNCTVSLSYQSGGNPITIYSIKDKCEVTMTLTAPDKTTKVVYKLVFNKLSEDTSISSVKVIGTSTDKEYTSNSDKADDENVDYFFVLDSETDEEPKCKFVIEAGEENATVTVNGAEYSETTEFGTGTYEIVITAAAGNTKTYKVTISAMLVLEFDSSSNYNFILEDREEEDGEVYYYRRTYTQKGWVHGKDDKDLDRFVIGGVLGSTNVRAFLANFASNQQGSIKLYDGEGTLITDGGNAASGIDESDLTDADIYSVGTGWYIDFGTGATPTERVYISVLGDVDGDGYVNAVDKMEVMSYTNGLIQLTVEYRLAAYLENDGNVSPADAMDILAIANNLVTIDFFMNN